MIKRIIFDLDNTLIEWKDEYIFALRNVLDKFLVTYTEEELFKYDSMIVQYEKEHDIYTERDFVNFINNSCGSNLSVGFAKALIKEQGKCFKKDEKLVKTIQYLKTKYDLALLSNWFTETQKLRLEGVGILDYFSIVSGGDEHLLKPSLEAFSGVIKDFLPS